MIRDDVEKMGRTGGKCPDFRSSKVKGWGFWCEECGYHKDQHKRKGKSE